MARDIEEFLRRAAERRRQAQQTGKPQERPPQQRRPPQSKPVAAPLRETVSEQDVVSQPKPVLPSLQTPSLRQESVEEHVRKYIDTSDIAEHVDHLAEDIEQSDERMEAHLDTVFDHDVGKLGSGKSATDELERKQKSNQIAESLLELFSNPESVRQSILVAEILKRPSFEDD